MTYEYECCDCGSTQEELHGMNESPEIICCSCKSKNMKRIISGGTGVIFKGGGWTTSDSQFKRSMTKKNEKAGQKAKDHVKPVTSMDDL